MILIKSSPMFDSIEIVHDILCDNCEQPCEEGHGDRDRAVFCCLCAHKDAPARYRWEPCAACRRRMPL